MNVVHGLAAHEAILMNVNVFVDELCRLVVFQRPFHVAKQRTKSVVVYLNWHWVASKRGHTTRIDGVSSNASKPVY